MRTAPEALARRVLAAEDGAEALALVAAEDPVLALECAIALARHTAAVVPPRPQVFVNHEAERRWADDGARVTAALEWSAKRVTTMRRTGRDVVDETCSHLIADCEALHDEIADAADAFDYDLGCGTVHTVLTLLEVIRGDAPVDRVVHAAARVLRTPDEPSEATSIHPAAVKAAHDRKLRHRMRAMRPLLAGWVLNPRGED
ncbi:MAG: hypothetical protein KDK70_39720 [Myxococcales bacterium]|nr:hypothetical protein [Myxococcales bacterium]